MSDENKDMGWVQTPLMRKFHYFVENAGIGFIAGHQGSLCHNWALAPDGQQDLRSPLDNGTECVKCVRAYRGTYGTKPVQ